MKPILPASLPADEISGSVPTTRRAWLKTAALATGAAVALEPGNRTSAATADPGGRITRGRIRQSIMGWTFNPMPTPELAGHCRDIGLVAMEGINPSHYPLIRKMGLAVSLVSSHGLAGDRSTLTITRSWRKNSGKQSTSRSGSIAAT